MSKRTTSWMLGWLVVCVALSWTGTYPVGNAAHFAGLLLGVGFGVVSGNQRVAGIAGVLLCGVLAAGTLLWSPWSVGWLSTKAYAAFEAGDAERALPSRTYRVTQTSVERRSPALHL
jgi:hypothetical protein